MSRRSVPSTATGFGDDFNTAIPESFAQIQFGSKDKLLAVVANKEAKCVRVDGVNFYSWRTIQTGSRPGRKDAQVISGDLAIDVVSYKAISDQWTALGWGIVGYG